MTDEPKNRPSGQETQTPDALPPVVDAPHAPLLYFDGCLNFGVRNGIVNMTLAAERSVASGSQINNDLVVVAHLRMSIAAAQDLRAAIDNVLLLVMEAPGGAKN